MGRRSRGLERPALPIVTLVVTHIYTYIYFVHTQTHTRTHARTHARARTHVCIYMHVIRTKATNFNLRAGSFRRRSVLFDSIDDCIGQRRARVLAINACQHIASIQEAELGAHNVMPELGIARVQQLVQLAGLRIAPVVSDRRKMQGSPSAIAHLQTPDAPGKKRGGRARLRRRGDGRRCGGR